MNVVLRLLKASVEFMWWVVAGVGGAWGGWWLGGISNVISMSNPTTVLRLCCWLS